MTCSMACAGSTVSGRFVRHKAPVRTPTALSLDMDHTPFLVALRALGRMGIGLKPSPADEDVLRESVAPREAKLPIGDLCYLILKRELNGPRRAGRRGFGKREPDQAVTKKRGRKRVGG